jgi:hypothetical protein
MGISNGTAEQEAERDGAGSGVRGAPAFDARLEAALAATERTESTLADLVRTVKFLSATIGTVRDANKALAREFDSLAAMVVGERVRLLSEQNEFVAMLVADHERELGELRRQLAELETAASGAKAEEA